MENPWRVATNYACGEKHYQVYRFRHPGETDHTGNGGAEYIKPKRKLKPSPMS
jgi:hypothetical protein